MMSESSNIFENVSSSLISSSGGKVSPGLAGMINIDMDSHVSSSSSQSGPRPTATSTTSTPAPALATAAPVPPRPHTSTSTSSRKVVKIIRKIPSPLPEGSRPGEIGTKRLFKVVRTDKQPAGARIGPPVLPFASCPVRGESEGERSRSSPAQSAEKPGGGESIEELHYLKRCAKERGILTSRIFFLRNNNTMRLFLTEPADVLAKAECKELAVVPLKNPNQSTGLPGAQTGSLMLIQESAERDGGRLRDYMASLFVRDAARWALVSSMQYIEKKADVVIQQCVTTFDVWKSRLQVLPEFLGDTISIIGGNNGSFCVRNKEVIFKWPTESKRSFNLDLRISFDAMADFRITGQLRYFSLNENASIRLLVETQVISNLHVMSVQRSLHKCLLASIVGKKPQNLSDNLDFTISSADPWLSASDNQNTEADSDIRQGIDALTMEEFPEWKMVPKASPSPWSYEVLDPLRGMDLSMRLGHRISLEWEASKDDIEVETERFLLWRNDGTPKNMAKKRLLGKRKRALPAAGKQSALTNFRNMIQDVNRQKESMLSVFGVVGELARKHSLKPIFNKGKQSEIWMSKHFGSKEDCLSFSMEFLGPQIAFVAKLSIEGTKPPSELRMAKMVSWKEGMEPVEAFLNKFSQIIHRREKMVPVVGVPMSSLGPSLPMNLTTKKKLVMDSSGRMGRKQKEREPTSLYVPPAKLSRVLNSPHHTEAELRDGLRSLAQEFRLNLDENMTGSLKKFQLWADFESYNKAGTNKLEFRGVILFECYPVEIVVRVVCDEKAVKTDHQVPPERREKRWGLVPGAGRRAVEEARHQVIEWRRVDGEKIDLVDQDQEDVSLPHPHTSQSQASADQKTKTIIVDIR